MIPREDDPLFCEEFMDTKHRKRDYGNDKIIRSTIKSKSYLSKLLLHLPLPQSFNQLAFVTILCVAIACAIGIAEYIILNDLFSNVYSELQLSLIQFAQVKCLAEYSLWLIQAISIKEY